jgi:hypothetical protein
MYKEYAQILTERSKSDPAYRQKIVEFIYNLYDIVLFGSKEVKGDRSIIEISFTAVKPTVDSSISVNEMYRLVITHATNSLRSLGMHRSDYSDTKEQNMDLKYLYLMNIDNIGKDLKHSLSESVLRCILNSTNNYYAYKNYFADRIDTLIYYIPCATSDNDIDVLFSRKVAPKVDSMVAKMIPKYSKSVADVYQDFSVHVKEKIHESMKTPVLATELVESVLDWYKQEFKKLSSGLKKGERPTSYLSTFKDALMQCSFYKKYSNVSYSTSGKRTILSNPAKEIEIVHDEDESDELKSAKAVYKMAAKIASDYIQIVRKKNKYDAIDQILTSLSKLMDHLLDTTIFKKKTRYASEYEECVNYLNNAKANVSESPIYKAYLIGIILANNVFDRIHGILYNTYLSNMDNDADKNDLLSIHEFYENQILENGKNKTIGMHTISFIKSTVPDLRKKLDSPVMNSVIITLLNNRKEKTTDPEKAKPLDMLISLFAPKGNANEMVVAKPMSNVDRFMAAQKDRTPSNTTTVENKMQSMFKRLPSTKQKNNVPAIEAAPNMSQIAERPHSVNTSESVIAPVEMNEALALISNSDYGHIQDKTNANIANEFINSLGGPNILKGVRNQNMMITKQTGSDVSNMLMIKGAPEPGPRKNSVPAIMAAEPEVQIVDPEDEVESLIREIEEPIQLSF